MKSRARLDHQRFKKMSVSGNKLINIVNGMQEIKLTQSELGYEMGLGKDPGFSVWTES